jgi:hypothetical protein
MDSTTWGTYNELLRVIKFVVDTKTFDLKVQPEFEYNLGWNLKICCNIYWVDDPERRLSVTGFIIPVGHTDLLAI